MNYYRRSADGMKSRLVSSLQAAWLLLPWVALALDSDREQPVNVEADRAELDQATDTGIYTGDVVVTQGSLRLEAERLEIRSPQGRVESALATGAPARFKQRPEGSEQDVLGGGHQIDYLATDSMVVLTGEAWITQGEDTVRGNRIEYDINRDLIRALKGPGEQDRVRIILQPRPSSND